MNFSDTNKDKRNQDREKTRKRNPYKVDMDRCDSCGQVVPADALIPTPSGDVCGFCYGSPKR